MNGRRIDALFMAEESETVDAVVSVDYFGLIVVGPPFRLSMPVDRTKIECPHLSDQFFLGRLAVRAAVDRLVVVIQPMVYLSKRQIAVAASVSGLVLSAVTLSGGQINLLQLVLQFHVQLVSGVGPGPVVTGQFAVDSGKARLDLLPICCLLLFQGRRVAFVRTKDRMLQLPDQGGVFIMQLPIGRIRLQGYLDVQFNNQLLHQRIPLTSEKRSGFVFRYVDRQSASHDGFVAGQHHDVFAVGRCDAEIASKSAAGLYDALFLRSAEIFVVYDCRGRIFFRLFSP